MKRVLLSSLLFLLVWNLYGQTEDSLTNSYKWLNIDYGAQKESVDSKIASPLSAGVFHASDICLKDFLHQDGGSNAWETGFFISNSKAVGLVFDVFFIPEGLEVFISDASKKDVRGPFTFKDKTDSHFYLPPINSDSLIVEVRGSESLLPLLNLHISEILVMSKPVIHNYHKGFGGSESCEINVNCSEGDLWEMQKKSVVRILLRKDGQAYWCTGTLVNNTNNDYHPYLLTADHCGNGASEYDLSQWVFYFNYAFEGCDNIAVEPDLQMMTGCRLIASGGDEGDSGSDFYLVELLNNVPFSYDPYFCGWDRSVSGAASGVTIHHPDGDVKKISTFNNTATTADWNGSGVFSHWEVTWSDTENGHGVTEGGSSGAPLFNPYGYITGTLTGGLAACEEGLYGPGTGPDEPDFFGKFGFSWNQNGSLASEQLMPWLDPQNLNPAFLEGLYNSDIPVASFYADTAVIIGNEISFTDRSAGVVEEWNWYFEGGIPETSNEKNPPPVSYSSFGAYDVRLVVSNSMWSDTLWLKDYIKVISNIYPIPATGYIFVFVGEDENETPDFEIFDSYGRAIQLPGILAQSNGLYKVKLDDFSSGAYYIRIISGTKSEVRKFIVSDKIY